MKILIENISLLADSSRENQYNLHFRGLDGETISAFQTNESVLKAFEKFFKKEGETNFDKIIALCSKEVLSYDKKDPQNPEGKIKTIDYFNRIVEQTSGKSSTDIVQIIPLLDDSGNRKGNAALIKEICSYIGGTDEVYIDAAGGDRSVISLIELLSKILSYKDIKCPLMIYSKLDFKSEGGATGEISSLEEFERMTTLADAFHEFISFGKAEKFQECVQGNANFEKLARAMKGFSDTLSLVGTDKLDKYIEDIALSINDIENSPSADDNLEAIIIRQFLSQIKTKLLGDTPIKLDNEYIDYPRIIEWCNDNGLVQQALTIFNELIPVYLFDKKLITFLRGDKLSLKDFNPKICSHQENMAIYNKLLSVNLDSIPNDRVFNDKTQKFFKFLKFESNINVARGKTSKYDSIWNKIDHIFQAFPYKKKIKTTQELVSALNDKDYYKNFVFLHLLPDKGLNQIGDFKLSVDIEIMRPILYSCLYVKALRNQINHASDIDGLTPLKRYLLEPYLNAKDDSFDTIRQNISKALDYIRRAEGEQNQ